MGVHIETQDDTELMQVRSRELQLENTAKLEEIIPVVETIDDNIGAVDLPSIESNTSEIRDMVKQNLHDQIDLNDIYAKLEKVEKSNIEIKKAITRLSKKIDKVIGDSNE